MISSKNGSWYKSNSPKTEGAKFQTTGFFMFSCLIRKGTNLGPPDLESSQKGASGDTHIVHFGPHPICLKIPPSLPNRTHHNFATLALQQTLQCSPWQGYIVILLQGHLKMPPLTVTSFSRISELLSLPYWGGFAK